MKEIKSVRLGDKDYVIGIDSGDDTYQLGYWNQNNFISWKKLEIIK